MGLFSGKIARNVKWEFSGKAACYTFPAIGDVNGDKLNEVVVGFDDGSLYAIRGSDGIVAWTFHADGPIRSSPVIADVDGDGVLEVIFGSDDRTVYALNGVDGRVTWAVRVDGPIRSRPAVADLDGDGHLEVIVTGDDARAYCLEGSSGEVLWQSSHTEGNSPALVHSAPCLVDLDGDGILEIVTGCSANCLLIFNPDGSLRARREFETPGFNSSPACADIDGDGSPEIVACSDNGVVYVMDNDGDTLWSKIIGVHLRSSPVLADLDGDGKMEILVVVMQREGGPSSLVCLSGEGDVLWQRQVKGKGAPSPIPADLDHDGGLEIVTFTAPGRISLIKEGGEEARSIGSKGDAQTGCAIGDLDLGADLEVVYTTTDGSVVCIDTDMDATVGEVLSSGARADNMNTGAYRTILQLVEFLRKQAKTLDRIGADPRAPLKKLESIEKQQGTRDIRPDLERLRNEIMRIRAEATRKSRRSERLKRAKEKLKVFSSLDLDGASKLSLAISRIERLMADGADPDRELDAVDDLIEELEEKSRDKLREVNTKRLSFLVGQFLEKFPDPSDDDIEEFIKYLESEGLPFLPYEIKRAVEKRRHERKFRSLREAGRLDYMSEEEKVITIGSSLSEAIIRDLVQSVGVSVAEVQKRLDELQADYSNVPRLVVTEEGKVLTDELRSALKAMSPEKAVSAAVSLFCLYVTKLFDYFQEVTDFETAYSRVKSSLENLSRTFGAEEIVSQFQERACHGIFAEEVRVKRILEL